LDLIRKHFKDLAAEVSIRFFQEDGYGRFNLREQYNTERMIQQIDLGSSAKWLKMDAGVIKKGLLKCVQNVVLIRNPSDPDSFYPVMHLFPALRKFLFRDSISCRQTASQNCHPIGRKS